MLILQFWRVAFVKISPLMNIQIYICIKMLHKNHWRKNSHSWKVLLRKFCENEVICCQNLWLFKMEVFWRNESNFRLNLLNPGNVVVHSYSKKTSQLQLLIIIYICYIARVHHNYNKRVSHWASERISHGISHRIGQRISLGFCMGSVRVNSHSPDTMQWLGIELPEQLNMKATLWCFGGSRLFGKKQPDREKDVWVHIEEAEEGKHPGCQRWMPHQWKCVPCQGRYWFHLDELNVYLL